MALKLSTTTDLINAGEMPPLQWVVQEQDLFAFQVSNGYTNEHLDKPIVWPFFWIDEEKKESLPTNTNNHQQLFQNLTEMKHELTAPVSPSEDLKRDTSVNHNKF